VIRRTWGAIITAFATGSVFVVLHILSESVKGLLEEVQLDREKTQTSVDVIVPTTYNTPSLGTVMSIFFLLFAGWFTGATVSVSNYPTLFVTGLFSLFGSATLAIPFLLDFAQLPADLFRLYIAVDVIASRFAFMVSTMNITALAILGTCAMQGRLTIRPKKLVPVLGGTVIAVAAALLGSHLFFTHVVGREYEGYRIFVEMDLRAEPVPATVRSDPQTIRPDSRPAMDRIRERGMLRVCYRRDALPFAFMNAAGRLVGHDIAMAHHLARQLGVTLEFVNVEIGQGPEALRDGICDIAMLSVPVTPERSRQVAFVDSHMDETAAFLVRDHRRDEFNSDEALRSHDSLRIGMPDVPYYEALLRQYLPQAEIVVMDSPRPFLRGDVDDLDAFLYSAEGGSAWTLVYPDFTVAVPKVDLLRIPVAYSVRHGDPEWLEYLDVWIQLKKKDGTLEQVYEHWILGREAEKGGPRWSVIRDVLGWVE
jgi:ABC-type amino acid transport substrate-binding protein